MQDPGWIQKLVSKHRLFVIGIFILAGVAYTPYLFPGGPSVALPKPLPLVIDEGTVLYDSFRITCGEVMYRDFFQFQGPVFYYIHAGLFGLTGPSFTAARALNLVVTALSAVFIALLVARSLGRIAGAVAAAVHACLLVAIYPYAYPQWLAEGFALAGIYLLTTSKRYSQHDWAAGACLGLSTFTIQSLGLPILAACMVALALPGIAQRNWKEAYVHSLRLFGGALLSISPFIIYLGVVGALGQMWYATVEWVLNHYSEGQKDAMTQGYGAYLNLFLILHRKINQPWRTLAMGGLQIIKFLPAFAISGVIVVILQTIIHKWRHSLDYGNLVIGTAIFAVTTPLLLGMTRFDLVHIAFIGSFGLCGAAITSLTLVNWKPRLHLLVVAVWIFVGIIVIANYGAKTVLTYQPSRKIQGWKEQVLKIGVGQWIDSNVGPNERIVTAWGDCNIFLSDVPPWVSLFCHSMHPNITAMNSGEKLEVRFWKPSHLLSI